MCCTPMVDCSMTTVSARALPTQTGAQITYQAARTYACMHTCIYAHAQDPHASFSLAVPSVSPDPLPPPYKMYKQLSRAAATAPKSEDGRVPCPPSPLSVGRLPSCPSSPPTLATVLEAKGLSHILPILVHEEIDLGKQTYTHLHTCTHIDTHLHTHARTHTYTFTPTHPHTHTQRACGCCSLNTSRPLASP
jgi:hypothetical protein